MSFWLTTKGSDCQVLILNLGRCSVGGALVICFAPMVFAQADGTVVRGTHICDSALEIDCGRCDKVGYWYSWVMELIYWSKRGVLLVGN